MADAIPLGPLPWSLADMFSEAPKELAFMEAFIKAWTVVSGEDILTIEPPYLDKESLDITVLHGTKRMAFRLGRATLARTDSERLAAMMAAQTFRALTVAA